MYRVGVHYTTSQGFVQEHLNLVSKDFVHDDPINFDYCFTDYFNQRKTDY